MSGLVLASCTAASLLLLPAHANGQTKMLPTGSWMMKTHMPAPRGELAVTVLDGRLYALAGAAQGQDATPLAQAYNPATDTWQTLAPIPQGLSHAGATSLNGKVYVVGGFTANVHAGAVDSVFEYDPARNAWRKLASMSSPRGSVGVVALDGKVHAIGGRGLDKVTVRTHEVYDPASDKWSPAAPLPVARDHLAAIAVDGKIHVIGGRKANNTTDNTAFHDIYDPRTNTWAKAAPMPTARSAMAVVLYKGMILVDGGECDHGRTFVQNEAYDPKADRWVELQAIVGRHGFGAGTMGDLAYFVGGNKGCGGADTTDELLGFHLP